LEGRAMVQAETKQTIEADEKAVERPSVRPAWGRLEHLHREVDRLFEDFDRDFWRTPLRRSVSDVEQFWRRQVSRDFVPAVDIVEQDAAYEVTVELPGLDGKNIEVKLANDSLAIKGEKQSEKEEKKEGFYLHERRFGAFERYLPLPEGVDANKIEASFKDGVLTVILPKNPEGERPEKKIEVKTT